MDKLEEIKKHHKDTVSFRSSTTKYEKEHAWLISEVERYERENYGTRISECLAARERALERAEKAEARVEELEKLYRHTHVGPNRMCAECELDLTDALHVRAVPAEKEKV